MANKNETEDQGKSSAVMHCYNFRMYQNLTEVVCIEASAAYPIVCNDTDLYVFSDRHNDYPELLWRYNIHSKSWDELQCENIPVLSVPGLILDGKLLLVLGYDEDDTNMHLFVCDLEPRAPNYVYKFQSVPTTGEKPLPSRRNCVLKDEEYLYTVGGAIHLTTHINVHRLNLRTNVWEALFLGKDAAEPKPRYGHRCVLFNKKIYVFGGSSFHEGTFGFKKLPVFDLETFKWSLEKTNGDTSLLKIKQYPGKGKYHGCVQNPGNMAQIFIIAGRSAVGWWEAKPISDCWMIDLNTMTWTRMPSLDFKLTTCFHSSAVTPAGRLYTYGTRFRSGKLFQSWVQIPSLKEMCWEAVLTFIQKRVYVGDVMELPLPEQYKRMIRSNIQQQCCDF